MSKGITTLGGGCFWCLEAVMQRLKGVEQVASGYAGGTVPGHPTYKEVCSGLTGHAEVVQVTFDPNHISYRDLLMIFMTTHDPTQLNGQGADLGTQYRSVIFYHSEEQKLTALDVFKELKAYFNYLIVTQIAPATTFYAAYAYHHNYYNQNNQQGYCQAVIQPKLGKLRALYADRLKS